MHADLTFRFMYPNNTSCRLQTLCYIIFFFRVCNNYKRFQGISTQFFHRLINRS